MDKDIDAAGEKNQANNAKKRTENRGDNELARNGSKLQPAIDDEQNDQSNPNEKRVLFCQNEQSQSDGEGNHPAPIVWRTQIFPE